MVNGKMTCYSGIQVKPGTIVSGLTAHFGSQCFCSNK